jgi:hypothetical protein
MKQLKIIADQYNSQSSVSQARFNESITLAPHSRIWLDKISMNIISSGGDGTYTIGKQTITFNPSKLPGSATSQYKTFTIDAGTYSLPELLALIQDGFNRSLNSNPAFNSIGTIVDLGLGFLVTSAIPLTKSVPVVTISFVGATCETRDDVLLDDCSIANDVITPDAPPNPAVALWPTPLLGGAMLVATSLRTQTGFMSNNTCRVGLFNPQPAGGLQYGLELDAGLWYVKNGANSTLVTNQAAFQNTGVNWEFKQYCFYIDPTDTAANGLRFSIIDESGPTRVILYTTPAGSFTGYTTTNTYNFSIEWEADPADVMAWQNPYITYQPNIAVDNVGPYIDFASIGARTYLGGLSQPSLTTYPALPLLAPPIRNVVIKFVDSTALAFGLGFGTTTLPTIVGSSGSVTADNAVNFVNFIDLALDILNLPLSTFISSSSTTGRTNTLAYFTPQPQNYTSTSLYSYENKNITFIDINNEQPLVLEALQYRVYNPTDLNSFFVFSNLSITMFVSEPEEGTDVRIASA